MTTKKPKKKPAKPASAKPAPTPAQPPTRAPIAQLRPAQEAGTGLTFSFRVTLEPGLTVESMVEILRALPAGAVLVW